MARPARPWFRFYVEAVHDRKLRRLKPGQRWLWAAVMAAARESPTPGVLLNGADDDPMTVGDIADYAGMTVREVRATLPAFQSAEMLTVDETTGAWRLLNWEKRQPESDVSTERTRRHRAKHPSDRSEPNGNVPKPFPGTPEERPSERFPSRALTTESESETEISSSSGSSPGADPPPDDDDHGHQQLNPWPDTPTTPPDQEFRDFRIGEAVAILARGDLELRQQTAGLDPIGDTESWLKRARKTRFDNDGIRLLELAQLDPDATPQQLVDALENRDRTPAHVTADGRTFIPGHGPVPDRPVIPDELPETTARAVMTDARTALRQPRPETTT